MKYPYFEHLANAFPMMPLPSDHASCDGATRSALASSSLGMITIFIIAAAGGAFSGSAAGAGPGPDGSTWFALDQLRSRDSNFLGHNPLAMGVAVSCSWPESPCRRPPLSLCDSSSASAKFCANRPGWPGLLLHVMPSPIAASFLNCAACEKSRSGRPIFLTLPSRRAGTPWQNVNCVKCCTRESVRRLHINCKHCIEPFVANTTSGCRMPVDVRLAPFAARWAPAYD